MTTWEVKTAPNRDSDIPAHIRTCRQSVNPFDLREQASEVWSGRRASPARKRPSHHISWSLTEGQSCPMISATREMPKNQFNSSKYSQLNTRIHRRRLNLWPSGYDFYKRGNKRIYGNKNGVCSRKSGFLHPLCRSQIKVSSNYDVCNHYDVCNLHDVSILELERQPFNIKEH